MLKNGQLTIVCKDNDMVRQLDALAKHNNLSRSKYIMFLCRKAIKENTQISAS